MNLNDYINQANPVRFPRVILNTNEYEKVHHSAKGEFIVIPAIVKRFNVQRPYFRYFNSPLLWTTDPDGNPEKLSCFETSTIN